MVAERRDDETGGMHSEPAMKHTTPHDRGHCPAGSRALPAAGWFESSWDLQRGLEVIEGWAEPCVASQRDERFTTSRTALPRSMTAIA